MLKAIPKVVAWPGLAASVLLMFSIFTTESDSHQLMTEAPTITTNTTSPLVVALAPFQAVGVDDLRLLSASSTTTTEAAEQTTTTEGENDEDSSTTETTAGEQAEDDQSSTTEPDENAKQESSTTEANEDSKQESSTTTSESTSSEATPTTTGDDTSQQTSDSNKGSTTTSSTTTTAPSTTTTSTTRPPSGPDTDGATFYVSPSGNDSNDGQTRSTPWRNLQKALDRLNPGQTLYLMGGTYDGNSQYALPPAHWAIRRSGTPDAWIKVAAAPGERPVLQPTKGHAIEVLNTKYVEVSGLTIIGKGFARDVNDYGWGVMVRNSHHVRVVGNEVTGMPFGGISAIDSDSFELIGNRVHHNSYWGPGQGSGISIWRPRNHGAGSVGGGYNIRIVGNMSYSNENKVYAPKEWYPDRNVMSDGNGIIFDEGRHHGYSSPVLIANNLSFDNGGRGINVTKSSNVDVVHNTTYHNGKTQTLSTPGTELSTTWSHNIRFLNNFSVSRPGLVEIMLSEAYGWTAKGNVFVTGNHNSKVKDGNHFVYSGPGFVNGSTGGDANFELTSGSPALDRGVSGAPVGVDRSGRQRSSSNPDAGAYERN